MRIDAKFIVEEMQNAVTSRMMGVADSFRKIGDKGTVTIKISLEQTTDNGEIHVDAEVTSKQAPRKSMAYSCRVDPATGSLEATQMNMAELQIVPK